MVKGVSSYYNANGELQAQWVKTVAKQSQLKEDLEAFVDTLIEDVKGVMPKMTAPVSDIDNEMVIYPIGDPHIGMYSWFEETGDDFDLDIAFNDMTVAVSQLVSSVPATKTAVVLNLGDFFHADNTSNRTTRSGAILDVDTRWPKVLRVGAKLMTEVISTALNHHEEVVVKNLIGNHDDHSAYALSLILDAFYSQEPRVTVDLSPSLYWYYVYGNNLLGATHGHTVKLPNLPTIMAEDKPEDWGRTKYRYWYTGHVHHKQVIEIGSSVIESFRSLVGKDAWTAASGYRSGRDISGIVLHKEFGEVARQ